MSKLVSSLVLLSLLLVSGLAFATDPDVISINQYIVTKAGGFPYLIAKPGSYKLSSNLVVPADTTGIDIQANGVTLDLNGFSIIGGLNCDNGDCGPQPIGFSFGVRSQGTSTTIRNGHVSGFAYGVKTFGGLVEEVHARGNWYVGIEANDSVLRRNSSSNNVRVGIQAFNCLLSESTVHDNGINQVVQAGGGVFSRNVIRWYLTNGNDISTSVVNEHNSSCVYSGTQGICY